jgi:putative endonuclease
MTESSLKTPSPKSPPLKAPHWQKGWDAETSVAAYLQEKGYAILAHRLKTPFGEIDVLAEIAGMLVVVEVKARKTVITGLEAISPKQQQRLADAVSWFVAQNPAYNNHAIRFDCVVVVPNSLPMHIENAWGM